MIIIEKPSGCTINEFINKYKQENNIAKLCFCGRLDPMARGKVLILLNEECKLVKYHLNHDKIYQFYICFGIQTDTDDFLGILQNYNNHIYPKNLNNIIKYVNNLKNISFNQKFHKYSSKKINGKTLREQDIDNNPTHNVKIYNSEIQDSKLFEFDKFLNIFIIPNIKSIDKTKNFRQSNIINQWLKFKREYIFAIKIELNVSTGFYVRQFVRDLSEKFNFPMVTFDINRIKYNI